ncbi:hypothetical protein DAPPUDRAFT_300121 [Daphnia pulex]|uniref:Aromatic-L-amino-acid decarboxylase n=1 Tax=Daphnia pulex TaxID=6669 RepID=E9FR03_DAPPU|nr:hypothetical protein DAPPUDRAFT_300121 [Daphnia pulex]|eukprot:EFX90074.1 hypothetical protein DAPPUDRAFT_300121 [Daphnia pulex]
MDAQQFRSAAHEMIDFIIDYLENIRSRRVLPTVQPGYIRDMIPATAPEQGEPWQAIFQDVERVIMPGVTHWHSPHFHAYFPTGNSWPAILADILSDAIGCIGFSWIASPACTDLEVVMMDWLGQLLGIPSQFLACSGGTGGGVIQGTASEATLVALLAAKAKAINRLKAMDPEVDESQIVGRLLAYSSDQSHSSVERAGILAGVRVRLLQSDELFSLRGETLKLAMEEDRAKGFIPFFVTATLGTTPSCAFDDLSEIGPVCHQFENIWLHVDAAYAGSAFICDEYRHYLNGLELADSFNFNPHKWLLVNFDCSAMWLKNANDVVDAFNVDPLYLKHDRQGQAPDYRHWQIPLGRRFRSLKLWFVMRTYGAEGLRAHIRRQIKLACEFHQLVVNDDRFEVPVPPALGLVCFRMKGENSLNETLLKRINDAGRIHMVPAKLRGQFVLRLAVCSRYTESRDILFAWQELRSHADALTGQQQLLKN